MDSKQIFWKYFEDIGLRKEVFDITYHNAIAEIEKNDTLYARIQKFNELIEPQLAMLEDRALELATTFLLGYLKGHLPVEKIEEIGRELKEYIERDL